MGNEASAPGRPAGGIGGLAARNAAKHAEELRLLEAFEQEDPEAVNELLDAHPQLVYAHTKEGGIWHFSARTGNLQVLEVVAIRVQEASLHQKKQDKVMQQVSKAVADVNVAVNQLAQLPGMKIPLGRNIDINAQTGEGVSPLMVAAAAGHAGAVQFLLANGADAWLGDANDNCALHLAAKEADLATLDALVKHAAKAEARRGDLEAADRLVNRSNGVGLTPLHAACWAGSADAAKLLINAGAHFLVGSMSDALGAISCNGGSTPLHLAAMKGAMPVVRLLLRAYAKLLQAEEAQGVDPPSPDPRTLRDRYGKTPQDCAVDLKRKDVAAVLDPALALEEAVHTAGGKQGGGGGRGHAGGDAAAKQGASSSSKAAPEEPAPAASGQAAGPASQEVEAEGALAGRVTSLAVGGGAAAAGAAAAPSRAAAGDEPPEALVCPITNQLLKDPVVAADGQTYERSAIEVWFELGNTHFPGGHARISHQRLQEAPAAKEEVAAWRAAHPGCK